MYYAPLLLGFDVLISPKANLCHQSAAPHLKIKAFLRINVVLLMLSGCEYSIHRPPILISDSIVKGLFFPPHCVTFTRRFCNSRSL